MPEKEPWVHVLVMGNGNWGRAATLAEARKIARIKKTDTHIVYAVHPETFVDGLGRICWKVNPPAEIDRIINPRDKRNA